VKSIIGFKERNKREPKMIKITNRNESYMRPIVRVKKPCHVRELRKRALALGLRSEGYFCKYGGMKR